MSANVRSLSGMAVHIQTTGLLLREIGGVSPEEEALRQVDARTIVTERQAASRQGKRTADARAGLKSPRMPAPPRDQAFEVVRHTVPRDPAAAMRLRHKMASPTAPKLAHTVR